MSDARQLGAQLSAMPDDLVLPFRAEASGVKGRLARLGAVVDSVLKRHAYPEPVSVALGEAPRFWKGKEQTELRILQVERLSP